ncbi:MAG: SMP-30/gluconolactonase/LRE family protein [Alphaproteobacteria bacterium]|nr:SMP-30/gluconolactonase/LRE family protein [Alphaproteobacteria bacterium]
MRIVATGLRFPEGPVAMPDGSVVVVEIPRGTLTRIAPDGKCSVLATPGGGPNGLAMGPGGKLFVCNNGGFKWHVQDGYHRVVAQADDYSGGRIEVVDPATGKVERLYDTCNGIPLRGPNDLVMDGQGGFWFTDLGKVRAREMDRGGIYWAKCDGSEIREAAHPVLTPNGIGLSPDGKTLYAAETEGARLWAWEIVGPGALRKLAWPSPYGARLVIGMGGYQRFDSLKVAASGKVLVATLINGGITEIEPHSGTARHHPLPDIYVTNLCFGGPERKTAFVTLSYDGRLAAVDWHEPGLRLHHQ